MHRYLGLVFLVCSHAGAEVFRAVDAPPATIVRGAAPSADDAIRHVYFSEPLDLANTARLTTGIDLVQLEVDQVRALIAAPGAPDTKKLTYVRYTSGDMRLARALIDAKHAGIAVDILIDLNPVLTLEADDPEAMTLDFARTKPRSEDSPGYEAYRAFLAGGFQLGVDLFSQPIYRPNDKDRTPIFHEKAVVIEVAGAPSKLFISSANAAPNPRVNRTLELRDEAITSYYLEHVRDLKVLFSGDDARPIRDVPVRAPLQVRYDDDSSIRVSFTDGKYNPNDNIVNVLRNQHLRSALMSQFAFTYTKMADALVENLQMISPDARATLLLDDKFTDLVSWGVGLQLKGAMVVSPPFSNGDNRILYPKPKDASERIDLFVYQRPAVDEKTGQPRLETDEDGPPLARHVDHEKTTVLVDTTGRAYISFGSFNASGNFHNADVQLDIQTSADGWVHQAFDQTIRGLIEKEKNVFAIPALTATVRNALGMVTGHTDLQVTLKQADRFVKNIWKRDPAALRKIFDELLAQPTTLLKVRPLAERRRAVDAFLTFMTDYVPRLYPRHRNEHQIMKVLSLMPTLTAAPMTAHSHRTLIETALFGVVPDDQREAVVTRTMKTFGLELPVARQKRARKDAVAQAFDWDNTVMVMPTLIRLFAKTGGAVRDVSTEEFARVRTQLGVAGTAFADWEFRFPASFQQFRASENWRDGYFVKQLTEALGDPAGRAEAFEAFLEALSTAASAKMTYIVTARGNSVQEMIMGLVHMRQVMEKELFQLLGKKITLHLPPRENFLALSDAGEKISEAKAEVIAKLVAKEFRYDRAQAFRFFEDDVETRRVTSAHLDAILTKKERERVAILDPSEAPKNWSTKKTRSKKTDCDKILGLKTAG